MIVIWALCALLIGLLVVGVDVVCKLSGVASRLRYHHRLDGTDASRCRVCCEHDEALRR